MLSTHLQVVCNIVFLIKLKALLWLLHSWLCCFGLCLHLCHEALQRIIFPTVALFVSTLAVAIFKPQIFVKLGIPGVIILATLFVVGLIHLLGRIREALERYAYRADEIHDSIMGAEGVVNKPYSRFLAGSFLVLGVVLSFVVGLLIGNYADFGSIPQPPLFWFSNPEFVLYPPIFVLVVDLMHSIASRAES